MSASRTTMHGIMTMREDAQGLVASNARNCTTSRAAAGWQRGAA
jgi:hypothetical protein